MLLSERLGHLLNVEFILVADQHFTNTVVFLLLFI